MITKRDNFISVKGRIVKKNDNIFRLVRNIIYYKDDTKYDIPVYYNINISKVDKDIIKQLEKGMLIKVTGDHRTYETNDNLGMIKEKFIINAFNISYE